MGFSEKGDELREKIKDNKVSHDHYYKGDQSMGNDIEINWEGISESFEQMSKKVDDVTTQVETMVTKWDTNGNHILENSEIMNGVLTSLPQLAKIISAIAAIATIIGVIRSYMTKEFDWILFLFAGGLLITFAIVYLVIKTQSSSTLQTVERIDQDAKSHYDNLKKRFIEYKKEAEKNEQKLKSEIATLEREKSAYMNKAMIYAYNASAMEKYTKNLQNSNDSKEIKFEFPDITKIQKELED